MGSPAHAGIDPAGRLLYLPRNVADKQWYAHGPAARQGTTNRVPVAWYAHIQAIVDAISPWPQVVWVDARGAAIKSKKGRTQPGARKETRWVYDDTGRGRRLVVKRDRAGRLIVVSYHPRPELMRGAAQK